LPSGTADGLGERLPVSVQDQGLAAGGFLGNFDAGLPQITCFFHISFAFWCQLKQAGSGGRYVRARIRDS